MRQTVSIGRWRAPVRRRILLSLLLAVIGGVALAGCAAPKPAVSFFSAGHAVSTLPTEYCNVTLNSCTSANVGATLRVPAGKPLQISVPADVANSTWLVAFKYRQANGQEAQGRSAVFASGDQFAYTLTAPTAGDQLELVEVAQIGGIGQGATGMEYFTRGVWMLTVTS